MNTDFKNAQIFGDINSSKTVFVSWGSNKGPIIEAQNLLRDQGTETAYIHFTYVYPINKDLVLSLFKRERHYVLIENNSHAQFGKLLMMETGIEIKDKLLKYDGRPFRPEEITDYVKLLSV